MEDRIIPRKDLYLRRVGSRYMIVEADEGNVNLTHVFSLNETAAGLWQQLEKGLCTAGQLAGWLAETYGISRETALNDVEKQLEEWTDFGLVEK